MSATAVARDSETCNRIGEDRWVIAGRGPVRCSRAEDGGGCWDRRRRRRQVHRGRWMTWVAVLAANSLERWECDSQDFVVAGHMVHFVLGHSSCHYLAADHRCMAIGLRHELVSIGPADCDCHDMLPLQQHRLQPRHLRRARDPRCCSVAHGHRYRGHICSRPSQT